MASDAIAGVRERWAEQIMSDEHLLGMLPEDAARLLLDHALHHLDEAATQAGSVEALDEAAASIRSEARELAERVAAADDPAAALRAELAGSETEAVVADESPPVTEEPSVDGHPVAAPEAGGPPVPAEDGPAHDSACGATVQATGSSGGGDPA